MKKITAKVITISSQLLVVSLFLFIVFYSKDNSENIVVNNNNFEKMSDKTSILFKREEKILNSIDDSIVIPLNEENQEDEKVNDNNVEVNKEDVKEETSKKEESNSTPLVPDFSDRVAIETFTGNLTGYGPDCVGCGGKTSTGYDLTKNIYYEDSEFGSVRIVAADKYFPFYSIIRISGVPGMNSFLAIVLDRGSAIGFQTLSQMDLLYESEYKASFFGRQHNTMFEVLRYGY